MNNIPEKTQSLHKICKKHKIIKLYLFGSFAKKISTENSDIDFLVTFGDVDLYNYFDNFLSVKNELEKLYERTVDLTEEKTIKNPFLHKSINQSKILLYEC